MNEELKKIVKKLEGSLLTIGINEENILDEIEKNDNIHTCYTLTNISLTGKKYNMVRKGRNKKVNIKKIKKVFKKKKLDNVICNYDTIKQFYRSFIPQSIYINKGKLYIYGNKKDLDILKSKYERYTKDIKIKEKGNNFILIINNENTKNNFFKDLGYRLIDFKNDALDLITDLLIN